jgi:hypothetical protein
MKLWNHAKPEAAAQQQAPAAAPVSTAKSL